MENATIKYKANCLTNVLFKMDFKKIETFEEEHVKSIIDALDGGFSVTEHTILSEYNFTKSVSGEISAANIESKVFVFFDSELKTKKITFTNTALTIEFFKYKNFSEFKVLVEKVIDKFNVFFQDSIIARIGLRYINQISHPKTKALFDWSKVINKALLSNVNNFFENDANLTRSLNQTILSYDSFYMTFTYGIANPDFPARVSRNEFLLDFDCFAVNVNKQQIIDKYLEKFHDQIQKYFEMAILEQLREHLGVTSYEIK